VPRHRADQIQCRRAAAAAAASISNAGAPASVVRQNPALRDAGVSLGVAGISRDGAFKHLIAFSNSAGAYIAPVEAAFQVSLECGISLPWICLGARLTLSCAAMSAAISSCRAKISVILAVVSLGQAMAPVGPMNQLHGHPDTGRAAPHAALKYVVHA